MAAIRQDIAGNDVYGKMDAFMSSRESLAGQPNVLAFMDAAQNNKQYIPFSPGPVLSQENMLLMKSGYVNASLHSRSAAEEGDANEETEQERDQRHAQTMFNVIAAQTMTYDGMTFTYEEVDSNLTKAIEQQEKFLERDLPEVKKDKLLFVNSKGEIVSADDPEARQVMTTEEQNRIENDKGVCTGKFAADKVTVVDGKMVSTDDAMLNMAVRDNIHRTQEALEKVRNGTETLDNLSTDLKNVVKEVHQTGTIAAVKEDTGPGVWGQLEQKDAQAKTMDDYQQRMGTPAPVRDFAPSPPSM